MTLRRRPGVVLFDVILGTTILVIAGAAFVALVGQNFTSVDQLRRREDEINRASQLLTRVTTVWSGTQLQAAVGDQRQTGFVLHVSEVGSGLFDVSVSDTSGFVLLRTSVYTPEMRDAH